MRNTRLDDYDIKPEIIISVLKQNNNVMSLRCLYRRLNVKRDNLLRQLRQMESIFLDERTARVEVCHVAEFEWNS
jgi:hypothetical protein